MRTALVTGASGQDGQHLCRLLVSKGYRVFGAVRPRADGISESRSGVVPGVVPLEVDITHHDAVIAAVEQSAPDEVYNLAAQSSVIGGETNRLATAEINGLGAIRVLEAVRDRFPKARFCQASSSRIFGGEPGTRTEQSSIFPASSYGAAKAWAHGEVVRARQVGGVHASNAILFNHESPFRPPHYVTRKISAAAARIALGDSTPVVLGNLDAIRDWGWAPDYVEAMWRMVQHPIGDDYVIATGIAHTVADFCDVAFAHVGLHWRDHVTTDVTLVRSDEPAIIGDASHARKQLGWSPTRTFTEVVRAMVDADLVALSPAHEPI